MPPPRIAGWPRLGGGGQEGQGGWEEEEGGRQGGRVGVDGWVRLEGGGAGGRPGWWWEEGGRVDSRGDRSLMFPRGLLPLVDMVGMGGTGDRVGELETQCCT